ncbi:ABC transporter substrate-binding protein [Micrococcales bacterium 31B]|nr:ABC transporter substrate-binding protein [Micrococcales bacterium 31B]
MTPRPLARAVAALTVLAVCTLGLAACNASATPPPASGSSGAPSTSATAAIDAERCAQNRAAGTVTYLTGYQYQASVSILDVIAAKQLGYFDAMCLDVEIQPGNGDVQSNAKLVAAGTATISGVGSDMDVMQAIAGGIEVTQVATEGHTTIDTLLTGTEITDLKQLEGKTLGHKGTLGPTQTAMLKSAGVDLSKVTLVKVGFDPMVLPRGQVQALTAYKSNEPATLKAQQVPFTEWDPDQYGVQGSFGAMVANPAFASQNPTAVQDFLRATAHALDYCSAAAQQQACVEFAAALSQAGYDTAHNLEVWKTESHLVASSATGAVPFAPVDSELTAQVRLLADAGVLAEGIALPDYVDSSFAEAVFVDGAVDWPAAP